LQVLRPHSLLSPGDSENARKPPMHLASGVTSKPKKKEKEREDESVDTLGNQHFDNNNPLIQ
jgi:hypothetical protein